MDLYERLKKDLADEDSRYAYADSVTNTFLTAQIKALREERELTQEKLAELVGTKQSGISRWQNSGYSGCKVETLRKFAKAFGVRLRISFEEFGSLPTDIGGFTKERLTPRKFEDDPVFKEPVVKEPEPQEAFDTTQWLDGPNTLAGMLLWPDVNARLVSILSPYFAYPASPRGTTLQQLSGMGAPTELPPVALPVIRLPETVHVIVPQQGSLESQTRSQRKVVVIDRWRHRSSPKRQQKLERELTKHHAGKKVSHGRISRPA